MPTLTTAQKAPILDQDGVQLLVTSSTVSSSDPEVCTPLNQGENQWYAVAQAPGTCTLTASRGGQNATLEVTVIAEPFSIQLGTPEPK